MINTRVIKTVKGYLSKSDLAYCVDSLKMGGVLVFPTDTVYGVGCNAFHPEAIQKIYALKGRSYTKPLPIFLSAAEQLGFVAKDVPTQARPLIQSFWPGALTLVFKTAPLALNAARGKSTIAVRIPDHGVVRQMLKGLQLPLAVTSANYSGHPSIKTGAQARKTFMSKVDIIIDGGSCDVGKESSVIDASHFPFTVLREGAISKAQLLAEMGLV